MLNKLNPVLCGSAFKNKGVQQLLDAIVNWLPSPLDRGAVKGHDVDSDEEIFISPDDNEPFSAIAFKIVTDPYVGRLTYIRLYSGTLEKGMHHPQYHQGHQRTHFSRLLEMHANQRKERDEFHTGDIAACVGLKKVTTGDTLCSPEDPSDPGEDGVPRTRYLHGDRTKDKSRPRKARQGARLPV